MALTSRQADHSGFTNKSAPLTNAEIDENWFDLYDLIESNSSAIGAIHTQNTDTYLDQGGANEVSAATLAALVYEESNNPLHLQNSDTKLAEGTSDEVTAAELTQDKTIQETSSSENTTGAKYIMVDTTSSPVTITFRSADIIDGKEYKVKDYIGNATANNITLATEGSETINGLTTITISVDGGYAVLVGVGGNLVTIGQQLT